MRRWVSLSVLLAVVLGLVALLPGGAQADSNDGVAFGPPAVFSRATDDLVVVLATNTSTNVKSFLMVATFWSGDVVTATATGVVNDLRPGERRAVQASSFLKIPPYDRSDVRVDLLTVDQPSTANATAATRIALCCAAVTPLTPDFVTVEVKTRNDDSVGHSFWASVAFLNGDQVVGFTSGAVNDLSPGQETTATLVITGSAQGVEVLTTAADFVS